MKKAVLLVMFFMFCVISLSAQEPRWKGITLNGENETLLEGTTWIRDDGGGDRSTYEFRAGGRVTWKYTGFGGGTVICTWSREGDIVKIIQGEGHWFSEGKYYPQTQRIMMITENSLGRKTDETWELFQGSSIASAPTVPAPSTNVQQSSPAQSAQTQQPSRNVGREIAEAFKSPLQSGTYSLAGTQEKISIAAIAKSGIISQTWQGKTYQGTYNIDGTRMTVQIRGYTFVFNITSETSFSGHGETWVRTGF
jgi:hypothetical protein